MGDVIAVASGKGGVGKSTFSYLLANAFSAMGRKTLLIDLDTGLNALDILFSVREHTVFGWNDAIDGRCGVSDAVTDCGGNIFLLSSPAGLNNCERIGEVTEPLRSSYDHIILDAPAGLDNGFVSAVKACDRAIMLATPDIISVQGAAAAARHAVTLGLDISDIRIVINRFVKKEAQKTRLLNIDGVIDSSGVRLIGIIPEDRKIVGMSVTGFAPSKKSAVLSAAVRIARRVESENIPLDLKHIK